MVTGHSGDGRITEKMVKDLEARLNKPVPGKAWTTIANRDSIRHAALAVGDENPLYMDEEYARNSRFHGLIAPPLFPYVAVSASAAVGGVGFPGIFALHAVDEWTFVKPVCNGDTLTSSIALVGLEKHDSKWGGTAYHQTMEFRFTDQNGELVAIYAPVNVRAERAATREKKKYEGFQEWKYSDGEIAEIEAGYDAEERRGAIPRYWEDVNIGDTIGHVVKGPLTVTDIICWWMGMGAPYLFAFGIRHKRMRERPGLAIVDPDTNIRHSGETAHFDDKLARRSGAGAPYDIGRQRTAWFMHLLTNWAGDAGWVSHIRARFDKPNYVGDTTWVPGTVAEKVVRDGVPQVRVDMTAVTQRGVIHSTASAWIQLPQRAALAADRKLT